MVHYDDPDPREEALLEEFRRKQMNGDDHVSDVSDKPRDIEIKAGVHGVELKDCYVLSLCMHGEPDTFQSFAKNSKILEDIGWRIDPHSIRTNTFANKEIVWMVATFHRVTSVD